jgi:hypothetical protein
MSCFCQFCDELNKWCNCSWCNMCGLKYNEYENIYCPCFSEVYSSVNFFVNYDGNLVEYCICGYKVIECVCIKLCGKKKL